MYEQQQAKKGVKKHALLLSENHFHLSKILSIENKTKSKKSEGENTKPSVVTNEHGIYFIHVYDICS